LLLAMASESSDRVPKSQAAFARFEALTVALRDANGKAIPNAKVTFHCNPAGGMDCQLAGRGDENGTLAVSTDYDGISTLSQMGGRSIDAYLDFARASPLWRWCAYGFMRFQRFSIEIAMPLA
jgi:hypothetical protein